MFSTNLPCLDNSSHSSTNTNTKQWRSQDEQVTLAQHGHIQCAHGMHLLGELGHAPAMEIIHSEITSEAVFSQPVCSLHVW